MLQKFLYAFLFFFFSTFSISASVTDQIDGDGFYAATVIEDPEVSAAVSGILTVYELYFEQNFTVFNSNEQINLVDFYFASGSGFIEGGRVARKALAMFDSTTSDDISELQTLSEVCFVQKLILPNEQKVTLVVHNEDFDFDQDVFRCLVAGLWYHSYENLDGVDTSNWKDTFAKLLNSKLSFEQ